MTSEKQNKIQTPNSAVAKKYTAEEAQKIIIDMARLDGDLRVISNNLAKNFVPKLIDGSQKEKEEAEKNFGKETTKLFMALGMKTHAPLVAAIKEDFRPYALTMINEIVKEYDCKTPSEKALCDMIINSYIKVLTYTTKFNNCVEAGEYISEERTKYLAMMSKELDRANRQFISALGMMRQMKSPSIEVNVKAKTAFVSQNQQINANNNLQPKNEIIEPK